MSIVRQETMTGQQTAVAGGIAESIPAEGLGVRLEAEQDPQSKMYSSIRLLLTLPGGFPDKYSLAIVRSCGRSRSILSTRRGLRSRS
jgi:hypothetical protein